MARREDCQESRLSGKFKKIIFAAFWLDDAYTYSKSGESIEDFADLTMSALEFTRNGSECRAKVIFYLLKTKQC